MEGLSALSKLLAPLKRRILLTIGRAVLQLVDDAKGLQRVQLTALSGEVLDGVERIQEYGFTSVPLPGAEGVIAAVAGERAHSLLIAVDDRRYRLRGLAGGEVALYDDLGQVVHLKRDGIVVDGLNIMLRSPGTIRIEGEGVEIHGRTYVQTDVHGKGSRETWSGGTAYETDSYTAGAATSATEHGLAQPAVASDHPEAAG